MLCARYLSVRANRVDLNLGKVGRRIIICQPLHGRIVARICLFLGQSARCTEPKLLVERSAAVHDELLALSIRFDIVPHELILVFRQGKPRLTVLKQDSLGCLHSVCVRLLK